MRRILLSLLVVGFLTPLAFAQKNSDHQRPENPRVVSEPVSADDFEAARADERATAEAVPLRDTLLPYHGYGTLAILNDGTLVIDVGGELVYDAAADEFTVASMETIAYRIDTAGLSLVEHRGEVFLDRNGAQVADRGLTRERVSVTPFPAPNSADGESHRRSIMDFSGDLDLRFDPANHELALTITDTTDTGESGMTFTLAAPVVSGPLQKRDPGSREVGQDLPGGEENDAITLTAAAAAWSASCSVDCTNGSCSISCSKKGALCSCSSTGYPQCRCIKAGREQ